MVTNVAVSTIYFLYLSRSKGQKLNLLSYEIRLLLRVAKHDFLAELQVTKLDLKNGTERDMTKYSDKAQNRYFRLEIDQQTTNG